MNATAPEPRHRASNLTLLLVAVVAAAAAVLVMMLFANVSTRKAEALHTNFGAPDVPVGDAAA